MRRLLLSLVLLITTGCCHRQQDNVYVTRAELRDLLAPPGPDAMISISPDRDAQLARIAADTFVEPPAPTSAPQAMATADAYTARLADAIRATDRCLEICADNIANAETTAYKRVYAARSADGAIDFRCDMEQGSLQNTNRPLDLGISGGGFLRVKAIDSPDGVAYTRNGNLFVNNAGQLVLGAGDGYLLDPPVAVPQGVTEISITEDGQVQVVTPGQDGRTTVGRLQLALFRNPEGLMRHRGSLFLASPHAGTARMVNPGDDGAGVVLQGFLESSNVDLAREYVRVRFLRNWRLAILRAIDAR